jgi:hypothetical protein
MPNRTEKPSDSRHFANDRGWPEPLNNHKPFYTPPKLSIEKAFVPMAVINGETIIVGDVNTSIPTPHKKREPGLFYPPKANYQEFDDSLTFPQPLEVRTTRPPLHSINQDNPTITKREQILKIALESIQNGQKPRAKQIAVDIDTSEAYVQNTINKLKKQGCLPKKPEPIFHQPTTIETETVDAPPKKHGGRQRGSKNKPKIIDSIPIKPLDSNQGNQSIETKTIIDTPDTPIKRRHNSREGKNNKKLGPTQQSVLDTANDIYKKTGKEASLIDISDEIGLTPNLINYHRNQLIEKGLYPPQDKK